MIGGRKVRSNKGKRRGPYGSHSRTRSGAKFRGRNVSRKNNKSKRSRKVRSNKGKKRGAYGPRKKTKSRNNNTGRTRSGSKFRGRSKRSYRRYSPNNH
jgi:hypothetical protein